MEKQSVQGISLRGSMFAIARARPHRTKFSSKVSSTSSRSSTTSSVASSSPEREAVVRGGATKPITTVDGLMQALRQCIYAEFSSVDLNITATSAHDNYLQQAFRFFTTTNTISPEAFHHKVVKLGLSVTRVLCMQLFGRIDQEDIGEITYATFARRIFLSPPLRLSVDVDLTTALDDAALSPGSPRTIDASSPRPPPSMNRNIHSSSPMSSPRTRPPTPASLSLNGPTSPRQSTTPRSSNERLLHHHTIASLRSPREVNADGIALIYEHMSLDEIERCISQKLEEKTSRSTDRFRQAFRFFTKSEGITFIEFAHHLELLQIHLSTSKCRALFSRFDLDSNGTIDLSEFAAALFNKYELERDVITPSSPASPNTKRERMGFEVEAGSALTIDQVLSRLRDKLAQHTSKETDRFRQAYKIFHKSHGITPLEFNVAMGKLGMKLTDAQMVELFALFDFDKSGDLDLNEFVQGVMLDDSSPQLWTSVKDRQRLEETRKTRYSMAVQSVQNSWTIAEIEQMLRAKIEQRTSKSSDCFRQAFRIFKKVNSIKPQEFHAALETIGLALDRKQSDVLFNRFDANGSGDIDLDEFIHGVLPPDYTGSQWVAAADELHRIAAQQKKLDAKQHPDQYMTEFEVENWSLDEIEKKIRDKIQQATSKSSDIFRQAYKIFKKSTHVTIDEFRERLLALGFRLTTAQCQGLFRRYDTNNSGDIDLQEFCMRILPPDYTGDGDYWSHSQNYHKLKQRERLEYVKRTKNGLISLPTFEESRRYTKGHYDAKTFRDLESDAQSPLFSGDDNDNDIDKDSASGVKPMQPTSPAARPASRPSTPRTPRPTSPAAFSINASLRAESPCDNGANVEALVSPSRFIRGSASRGASSRTLRVATSDDSDRRGPTVESLKQQQSLAAAAAHSPTSPSRPSPARPPMSPRAPTKVSSPRCPTLSNGAGHSIVEFEDDEILDDDRDETMSSMDRVRAKRRAQRQHQHDEQQLARSPRRGSGDGDNHASVSPAKSYAASVAGSATMSVTSTTSSKVVGTAKYTPQRGHTLLIKRFLLATKRSSSDPTAASSASSPRVSSSNNNHKSSSSPHSKRR